MSIRAPSPWSSRSASSIVCWTTAAGSRAPEIRVPSSRSERSTIAWRSSVSRERASSRIRRALAIARPAWSASARTSATWGAAKASGRCENVPSAPNTSSPAAIGATTMPSIPTSATKRSVAGAWTNRASAA